jgi:hypothetical protein
MTSPDDPDDKRDGFLGRWSRRKLNPEPASAPVLPPVSAVSAPAEPDDRPRDPETGELIDEDLVSRLPKVEDLQAGGDLSGYMQKGVPEALRREALRTMWLNDPMIRNYVSPALDYAYDYNAPGGAPGYGPLTESDMVNAREFLANVFSTPPKTAQETVVAQETGSRDNESHVAGAAEPAAVRRSDAALQNEPKPDVAAESPDDIREVTDTTELPQIGDRAMLQRNMMADADVPAPASRRRRGGGATPA